MDYDRYDALIFDCDGTLVDSMPTHFLAWQKTLGPHGVAFPEERFYATGGMPSWQIIEMLGREQGLGLDAVSLAGEKEAAFHELLDQVAVIEPIVAIARRYHGDKPLAVATGGRGDVAGRLLEALDLAPLFNAVVTADDVDRHKPQPDIYLEAARRLGRDPTRCVAFEDTDLGLTAAHAAGMDAVDVRGLFSNPP